MAASRGHGTITAVAWNGGMTVAKRPVAHFLRYKNRSRIYGLSPGADAAKRGHFSRF